MDWPLRRAAGEKPFPVDNDGLHRLVVFLGECTDVIGEEYQPIFVAFGMQDFDRSFMQIDA